MPRFYFDMTEGEKLMLDMSGIDCESATKAKSLATQTLIDIAKEKCGQLATMTLSIAVRQAETPIFRAAITLVAFDTARSSSPP